jgi:hypothetical protein
VVPTLNTDRVLVLTHCWPESSEDSSGVWLKRAFEGLPVMKIGKWGMFSLKSLVKLRRRQGVIIACWVIPAGVLAYLSGRPYIMYCLGLDCFWAKRHRLVAWLFRPILDKAAKLVFSSRHLRDTMNDPYGDRYTSKSQVIHLPVSSEEFSPA